MTAATAPAPKKGHRAREDGPERRRPTPSTLEEWEHFPTVGDDVAQMRLARAMGYPPGWRVVRTLVNVPVPWFLSDRPGVVAVAKTDGEGPAAGAAYAMTAVQDRIYAGDPATQPDGYYNHTAALMASSKFNWRPEYDDVVHDNDDDDYDDNEYCVTSHKNKGGQLKPREPKFEVDDVVEVLYDEEDEHGEWYQATIVKRIDYEDDIRYSVHYHIDDAVQSNVREENIRPSVKAKKKAPKKKNAPKRAPPKKKASNSSRAKTNIKSVKIKVKGVISERKQDSEGEEDDVDDEEEDEEVEENDEEEEDEEEEELEQDQDSNSSTEKNAPEITPPKRRGRPPGSKQKSPPKKSTKANKAKKSTAKATTTNKEAPISSYQPPADELDLAKNIGLPAGWSAQNRGNFKWFICNPQGETFSSKKAAFAAAGLEPPPVKTPKSKPKASTPKASKRKESLPGRKVGRPRKRKAEEEIISPKEEKTENKDENYVDENGKHPHMPSLDEGDPPWRTTGHEYLGRYIFWTPPTNVANDADPPEFSEPVIGKVVGWISQTDVDNDGNPGFVSSLTGKPAVLLHVVFDEFTQDVEEFEIAECFVDDAGKSSGVKRKRLNK